MPSEIQPYFIAIRGNVRENHPDSFGATEAEKYTSFREGKYCIGRHSEYAHVVFGNVTGATPDGRKQLEPLSIGAGSARGREKKRYTATLKSVSKLDLSKVITGVSVNLRFNPSLFDSEDKIQRFKDMIPAYFFDYGGQNLQTTVVDTKTLQQAQQHPEDFQDLLVRISGYSARFVELPRQTQDAIINNITIKTKTNNLFFSSSLASGSNLTGLLCK